MTIQEAVEWFSRGFEFSGEGFNGEWPAQERDRAKRTWDLVRAEAERQFSEVCSRGEC